MIVLRKFLVGRFRRFIRKDVTLYLVAVLSLGFGLIINVFSVLVRTLWFG